MMGMAALFLMDALQCSTNTPAVAEEHNPIHDPEIRLPKGSSSLHSGHNNVSPTSTGAGQPRTKPDEQPGVNLLPEGGSKSSEPRTSSAGVASSGTTTLPESSQPGGQAGVTLLPDKNPGAGTVPLPGNNPGVAEVNAGRTVPTEIEFLGSFGKGNRFVIIADRSGSMNSPVRLLDPITKKVTQPKSIDCLHEEMIKTLKSMKPGMYFYVCFFDHRLDLLPFGDPWMEGGQPLEPVMEWINKINAAGGTVPLPAFKKAFSLDPPPDVIFFMTDGVFPNIAPQIAELNNKLPKKVVINTIHFNNTSNLPGFNKSVFSNRYARLIDNYQLPAPVKVQLEGFARRPPKNYKPAKQPTYDKQLEQIAKDAGGTFSVFGGDDNAQQEAADAPEVLPQRMPVLAQLDQLTLADPRYGPRPGCRCKAYPVVLQANTTYQIDMVSTFKTYLYLEGPNGKVVRFTDNVRGMGLNSLITFRPQATATYRIIATTGAPNVLGPFILTVIDQPL
jgi:hypothetical protein